MSAPTLPILASVAAALAAGMWSVPSDHLRMQLQLRDHDLVAARSSFERLSAQVTPSGTTLHAAAQLYRDLGDADRSIVLLHEHLQQDPADVYSRRLLAQLYHDAGLLDAYMEQLRLLGAPTQDSAILLERADLLEVYGDTAARVEMLETLHALDAATPAQTLALAEYQAAERPSRAAQLLLEVDATAPAILGLAQRKLLFALLEQQQRLEEASALAQRWYGTGNVAEDEALAFSSWLLRQRHESLAAQILAAVAATSLEPAYSRSLLIEVYLRAGQRGEALNLLNQWHAHGEVPSALVPVWAELALEARDTPAIQALLPALRSAAAGDQKTAFVEHLYAQALAQLGAREELATVFESRLSSPRPERRSEALSSLLDLDRKEPVIRHLRSEQGATLPDAQQRQLAYRLLELGDKQVTIDAFRRLAANAAPDSDDVQTLLYLWGPRPDPAAMDWLTERARRASATEQIAWLRLLLERGGATQVAELLGSGRTALSAPQLKIYVQALAALERWEDIKPHLSSALAAATDAQEFETIAAWAERLDMNEVSERAWRALLQQRPDHPRALLVLGLRSYATGQMADAIDLLSDYLDTHHDDAEAHYFLAEALRASGRAADAVVHFERATQRLAVSDEPTARQKVLRALALNRLGKIDQAIAELDQLHRSFPADRQILEDYVGVLLENGRAAQARELLENAAGGSRG